MLVFGSYWAGSLPDPNSFGSFEGICWTMSRREGDSEGRILNGRKLKFWSPFAQFISSRRRTEWEVVFSAIHQLSVVQFPPYISQDHQFTFTLFLRSLQDYIAFFSSWGDIPFIFTFSHKMAWPGNISGAQNQIKSGIRRRRGTDAPPFFKLPSSPQVLLVFDTLNFHFMKWDYL